MQKLTNLLVAAGLILVVFAIIWHLLSVVSVVQATGNAVCLFSLIKSSPSNIVTFANAFMLMAVLLMLSKKKS